MRRPRAVVCGTTFGQVYLEAFRDPGLPVELAGVLGLGSRRSNACARHYGVPLYTDPHELPLDIDMACVVVRGGLLGGRGTELAQTLMKRGIHVLQEHPLHHDELAECLRVARKSGVVYRLNSFYVDVEPVRHFVSAARELEPVYIDAVCGFQVAYALLDILGTVLGRVRPWAVHGVSPPTGSAFRSLDGVIGGVPLSLRIQNQLDPNDPDNYLHILHRITIGAEHGNLLLVTTHGPVVWSDRPQIPRQVRDPAAEPLFASGDPGPEQSCVRLLEPGETPFLSLWPAAVRRTLNDFCGAVVDREDPLPRGQYHLALCQVWQEMAARLGPPELVAMEPAHG